MPAPAPKPIAYCPNPECGNPCETDEFDSSHWVWCRACKYCGPETTLGEAEAIRLHNLICRPQQSAEPVAWVLFHKAGPANSTLDPLIKMAHESDGGRTEPLFAASPGPSELVAELEALDIRECETHNGTFEYVDAADLRALITRHRGKS